MTTKQLSKVLAVGPFNTVRTSAGHLATILDVGNAFSKVRYLLGGEVVDLPNEQLRRCG